MVAPRVLGFRGEDIGERAEPEVGQVGHTPCRRGLGVARAWGVWAPYGPSPPPLLASFVFWENIIFQYFSGIFLIFAKLHQNTSFSIRILTPAVHPPRIIQHAKTDEKT